jgi:uncharacterized protein YegL
MVQSRVVILLDRSSSMFSIKDEAISAFNEQIKTIQKDIEELPTKVTLVTFSTVVDEAMIWNQDARELTPISSEMYQPSGMTALFDAMGQTINRITQLPEATDPNTNFQIIVISDGAENNSKTYTADFIKQRIKELEATKRFSVSYIGANQSMFEVSRTLGVDLGKTYAFAATVDGTKAMSSVFATAATNYRGALKSGNIAAEMDFTAAEVKTA